MISGLVKIYKEGTGHRQIILRLALPGSYIGMLSVLGDQIHQFSASAIESSDICFIDLNPFRNIIMENGKYGLKLLNVISQEALFIFKRLMSQSHKQLPGRIADVLLYFSGRYITVQNLHSRLPGANLLNWQGRPRKVLSELSQNLKMTG